MRHVEHVGAYDAEAEKEPPGGNEAKGHGHERAARHDAHLPAAHEHDGNVDGEGVLRGHAGREDKESEEHPLPAPRIAVAAEQQCEASGHGKSQELAGVELRREHGCGGLHGREYGAAYDGEVAQQVEAAVEKEHHAHDEQRGADAGQRRHQRRTGPEVGRGQGNASVAGYDGAVAGGEDLPRGENHEQRRQNHGGARVHEFVGIHGIISSSSRVSAWWGLRRAGARVCVLRGS